MGTNTEESRKALLNKLEELLSVQAMVKRLGKMLDESSLDRVNFVWWQGQLEQLHALELDLSLEVLILIERISLEKAVSDLTTP